MAEDETDLRVTSFTVSHSFDTFKGGTKATHFFSANFSVQEPASLETMEAMALRASQHVTRSVLHQALARGHLSVEEVNEAVQTIRDNHEKLIERLIKRRTDGG